MDEYAALAQRVVLTMDDVRGCLVLSRDGMVLGAYPEEDEQAFKPAWLKFVHVGEARRGFVEFSDQLWAYVHRGPYAAFVISGTGVRPGVLLDQLEQAVLAAEETRAKKGETLKVPDASSAPSGRPRTSLHPAEVKAPEPAPEPVVSAPPADQRAWNGRSPGEAPTPPQPLDDAGLGGGGDSPGTADEPERLRPTTPSETDPVTPAGRPAAFATEGSPFSRLEAEKAASSLPAIAPLEATPLVVPGPGVEPSVGGSDDASPGEGEEATPFRREPQRLVSAERAPDEPEKVTEEPSEVDRVMLAKEFSGLLQLNEDGDEDNS